MELYAADTGGRRVPMLYSALKSLQLLLARVNLITILMIFAILKQKTKQKTIYIHFKKTQTHRVCRSVLIHFRNKYVSQRNSYFILLKKMCIINNDYITELLFCFSFLCCHLLFSKVLKHKPNFKHMSNPKYFPEVWHVQLAQKQHSFICTLFKSYQPWQNSVTFLSSTRKKAGTTN